jgi:hypothetical protein
MLLCEGLLVSVALTSSSTTGTSSRGQQRRVDEWRNSGAEKPEHLLEVTEKNISFKVAGVGS